MSFNVRLFCYRGIVQLRDVAPHQASSDSVHVIYQPYEWAQTVVASGTAAASTAQGEDPNSVGFVRIEIPDGSAIRYEINPPNRSTAASTASPIMSGINNVMWGKNWTISVIDATGLA